MRTLLWPPIGRAIFLGVAMLLSGCGPSHATTSTPQALCATEIDHPEIRA